MCANGDSNGIWIVGIFRLRRHDGDKPDHLAALQPSRVQLLEGSLAMRFPDDTERKAVARSKVAM